MMENINLNIIFEYIFDTYGIVIENKYNTCHCVYESIFMNPDYCAVYDDRTLIKTFVRSDLMLWLRYKKINNINDRIQRTS